MLEEFDFDDSVFAIDNELFNFSLHFAILEVQIDVFVLNCLLHILNDELSAVSNLLLDRFIKHTCRIINIETAYHVITEYMIVYNDKHLLPFATFLAAPMRQPDQTIRTH